MPGPPRDYGVRGGRSTTVPYEDDGQTRIYVPVFVNGKGPFQFELDSGGHLILSSETVAGLGLTAKGALSSTGAGDEVQKSRFVRLDELRIGGAYLASQPAKVLPLKAERTPRPARAGILGLELFERFAVTIDRERKTVTLTPLEFFRETGKGQPLALTFIEDAPLAAGRFEGKAGEFMLDSGNAGPTIIEHTWAGQAGLLPRLAGGVGAGRGVLTSCGTLDLGPVRLETETVSYYGPAERGSEFARGVAGVVGEPTLSPFNMTYDYSTNRVWLEPAKGLARRPFNRSGLSLAKSKDGSFQVGFVAPGSPAAQAGLHDGDIVVAIDGRPSAELSTSDFGRLARQPIGTDLRLDIADREGGRSRRAVIRLANVLAAANGLPSQCAEGG
jgi:hypothetical protein